MSEFTNQWDNQLQQDEFMENRTIKDSSLYSLNSRVNSQTPSVGIINQSIPPNAPYNEYYNNYYGAPFTVPSHITYSHAYPQSTNIPYYPNNAFQYYNTQQPISVLPVATPVINNENTNKKENNNVNNAKIDNNPINVTANNKTIANQNTNIIAMQPMLPTHSTIAPQYSFMPNYSNFAPFPFNPTMQPPYDVLTMPPTVTHTSGAIYSNFNGVGPIGDSTLTTPVGSIANVSLLGGIALSTGNVSNLTSIPIALNANNNASLTASSAINSNDAQKDNKLNENSNKNDKTSTTLPTTNTTIGTTNQQSALSTSNEQRESETKNTEIKQNEIISGLQTLQTGIASNIKKASAVHVDGNSQTIQKNEKDLSLEMADLTIRDDKDNSLISFDVVSCTPSASNRNATVVSSFNGEFHEEPITPRPSYNTRYLNQHAQSHPIISTANMNLMPHYVPMNQFNSSGSNPVLMLQFADVQQHPYPFYTYPMNHGNEVMADNFNYHQNYAYHHMNNNRQNYHRNQYQNLRRKNVNNYRAPHDKNHTRTSNKGDHDVHENMFSIGDEALLNRHLVTIIGIDWHAEQATIRFHHNNSQKIVPIEHLRPRARSNVFHDVVDDNNDNKNNEKRKNGNIHNVIPTDESNKNNQNHNNDVSIISVENNNQANHDKNDNHEKEIRVVLIENSKSENNVEQKNETLNQTSTPILTTTSTSNPVTLRIKNSKLSDETLRKLPHLRKHIPYIKSIEASMGPKDYNQFRVTSRNNGKPVLEENDNYNNEDNVENNENNDNNNEIDDNKTNEYIPKSSHPYFYDNYNNSSDNDYDNTFVAQDEINSNFNNEDVDDNNHYNSRYKRNKNIVNEKGDLFKTELCENWIKKGTCSYGKKCHFAHGVDDIRNRMRVENYKTQPCCDPARLESRLCLFGKRCNYTHPGEPMRRPMSTAYLDAAYFEKVLEDYGDEKYPFGIYI